MSFAIEIVKPINDPIVLFEIDLPLEHNIFINDEPGIWKCNLTPNDVTVVGSDGQIGYFGTQNEVFYNIQSMKVNIVPFTKVTTKANLRTQNQSFLYEGTTIYVHFDGWQPSDVFYSIVLGSVMGFCDKIDPANDGYYNNVYYDPRIKSVPAIDKKKDNLFFGIIQFPGGTFALINTDGALDALKDEKIYGQACRTLLGFAGDPYSEYKRQSGGFVDDYDFNFDEFSIEMKDIRKRFSRTLPVAKYDQTTCPYLDDDNVDKNIPLAFGTVRDCSVVCVNDTESTPASYTFKLCYVGTDDLTVNGIKNGQTIIVRVDDVEVTPASFTAATATFTLSTADYDPDGQKGKVTADFIGYVDGANAVIENSLDIIRLILDVYLAISYISDNYNTTEWAAEKATADTISRFIDKDLEINDFIEEICATNRGIFDIQGDGKITFRTTDTSKTAAATIYSDEWLDDPQVDPRTDEYLTSVIVEYAKAYKAKEYRRYTNIAYESELVALFGQYKQRTVETLLTTSADAQGKSEDIMADSSEIPVIVERTIGLQGTILELLDIVKAEIDRPDKELFGMSKWEVLGVGKQLAEGKTGLTLKYIEKVA